MSTRAREIAELGQKLTVDGSGNLEFAGDLSLPDGSNTNNRLVLGDGDDAKFFHNGVDSYWINETGQLIIRNLSDDKDVKIESDNGSGGSTEYFRADGSIGQAQMFYYGSKKLNTTSTGIDVTGTVTADGLTSQGTLGNWSIDSQGVIQTFTRPSTSYIRASNAAGNIAIQTGGSNNRALFANNGDISFYEDTGTTAKFFWDASAERLGLGTTSPSVPVHISGYAGTGLRLETTASNGGGNNFIDFYNQDGRTGYIGYGSGSQDSLWIWNEENHNVYIGANNFEAVRVTPSATIINEQGYGRDFRVESDSNTHMLFVDAGNDRVNVGTAGGKYASSIGDGYGDFRVGTSSYGLSIGVATGGGGAGDTRIWTKGGTENLILSTSTSNSQDIRIGKTDTVINESGANRDFRVESDANSSMLFVDAGANAVCINTNTTTAQFNMYCLNSDEHVRKVGLEADSSYAFNVSGTEGTKTVTVTLEENSLKGAMFDMHLAGHYWNNGASTYYRHTRFYLMRESSGSTRINSRQDKFLGGSSTSAISVPVATYNNGTWKITYTVGSGFQHHATFHFRGPGTGRIYSISHS